MIAHDVAPGLPDLALFLPYSPLHHLLLADVGRPLVMTSGNSSDEPIAHRDLDASTRLGPMVDGLLTHDRQIHIRCDDSVAARYRLTAAVAASITRLRTGADAAAVRLSTCRARGWRGAEVDDCGHAR